MLTPDDGAPDDAAPQRDGFFDPWRVPRGSAAEQLVRDVIALLSANEARQRRRRPADEAAWRAMVAATVCDVAYHSLKHPTRPVAYSRAKPRGAGRSVYEPAWLSPKVLPTIVDGMASLGLLATTPGSTRAGRRQATMRATAALGRMIRDRGVRLGDISHRAEKPLLLLKALRDPRARNSGRPIEYRPTRATAAMQAEVYNINEWLAAADIALWDGAPPGSDASDRRLSRVFNGGWDQGGRLFGGFWQPLSKDDRRAFIRIDSEPVVELDFSQAFARIAYAHVGAPAPPGDLYDIGADLGWPRALVKTMFSVLLFDNSNRTRFPRGLKAGDGFPKATKARDVIAAIRSAHPAIVPVLGRGFGLRAMHTESVIILNVLKQLMASGVPGLPIHDAILVPASQATVARQAMEAAFLNVTGATGVVSVG